MKRIALIILVFFAFATVRCSREHAVNYSEVQVSQVSGEQSGTWSGEVHLVGDVIVPDEKTLTIASGTKVISDGYYGIYVNGSFTAIGSQKARISFTVADTTGYSNYEDAEAGAWKGINFEKPGAIRLEYCDFSYGKNALEQDGGMLFVYMADDVMIGNCRFHHNTTRRKGGAMYAVSSELNIHDCEVYDNFAVGFEGSYCWGVGFQFLKCTIHMSDMVFHHNYSEVAYGGGMNIDSCNLELTNSVFYNNVAVDAGGLGLQRSREYSVKVSNMLAYNNAVIHYGGGLAMATTNAELNNLTIVNNLCGGGGGAGMQLAFEACPTLNNCIFWGNRGIYFDNNNDTVDYYLGSQIWLWGADCYPIFRNGVVQYGWDTISGNENLPEEHYINMLKANPQFVNEQGRNYHLKSSSPCINTGLADISGLFIPAIDMAGNARIFGGRIDMGCYEWQGN